jgi:hypothetical protein
LNRRNGETEEDKSSNHNVFRELNGITIYGIDWKIPIHIDLGFSVPPFLLFNKVF